MACFRPLKGYRSREVNAETGRRSVVFSARTGLLDFPVDLPCGQCIGCRLERSRQWAMRCAHEATLYDRNCFITLTYDDAHLPSDRSLNKKHFQDFMKRLRFRFGEGIRFFHCGEYGEKFARPHYHACLFNFDFPDKVLWKEALGNRLYTSEALNELWPFGFHSIGDVTFESAAYVARYITKKVTGDKAADHYGGRLPEYTTMSRRPGLARGWYEKFSADVFPADEVVLRGKRMRPPKYYDHLFEVAFPSDFAKVKRRRKLLGSDHAEAVKALSVYDFERGRVLDRLAVLERVQERRFKLLKRGFEDGSAEDVVGL